jgi:hypothetical protein
MDVPLLRGTLFLSARSRGRAGGSSRTARWGIWKRWVPRRVYGSVVAGGALAERPAGTRACSATPGGTASPHRGGPTSRTTSRTTSRSSSTSGSACLSERHRVRHREEGSDSKCPKFHCCFLPSFLTRVINGKHQNSFQTFIASATVPPQAPHVKRYSQDRTNALSGRIQCELQPGSSSRGSALADIRFATYRSKTAMTCAPIPARWLHWGSHAVDNRDARTYLHPCRSLAKLTGRGGAVEVVPVVRRPNGAIGGMIGEWSLILIFSAHAFLVQIDLTARHRRLGMAKHL